MSSSVKCGVCFLIGAGIGLVAANYFLRKKYEDAVNSEIESIRKCHETREKEDVNNEDDPDDFDEDDIQIMDYKSYCEMYHPEEESEESSDDIHMISEDEAGQPNDASDSGFDLVELRHFADGYLVDDLNQIVENPEQVVGTEYLERIGPGSDETVVYVRNERLELDYEILVEEIDFMD